MNIGEIYQSNKTGWIKTSRNSIFCNIHSTSRK